MAAPSGITWGSIYKGKDNPSGQQGRLGIYISQTNTATSTTIDIQVWFWTIYSCSDTYNSLLFDVGQGISGVDTTVGSNYKIDHTIASGDGWDTRNQTKLLDKTFTYTRGTSAATYTVCSSFQGIDILGSAWPFVKDTFTVPALAKYSITYNANGGTGAPSSQTKYHGKTLTLSSTTPTRTGYTFKGWALSKAEADDGDWYYQSGGSCGKNENLTLYAVWEAHTYAVTYNANGGTGAPTNQTKTHGTTLKLSSTKPTKANYTFLGWATSATSNTVVYDSGGNYTSNAAITLYAVWELSYVKPRINDVIVYRCDHLGVESDYGSFAKLSFTWESDLPIIEVFVDFINEREVVYSHTIVTDYTNSGSVDNEILGDGTLSSEISYTVRIRVGDEVGYSTVIKSLSGYKFVIDILAEGKGIAFNKPAELEGVADIGFQTRFLGGLLYPVLEPETDLNTVRTPNTYVGANVSNYNYVNCPITSGTFTLEVISSGENGQVLQRLTRCDKTKPVVYERWFYTNAWGAWYGGWIYPELTSHFTMYGTSESANKPRYRKDGRLIEVRGIVTPTSDIAGGTDIIPIFTLPEGYRPDSLIYCVCQGSGACSWLLRITDDGEVGFSRYRNGDGYTTASANESNTGTWLPFQITYFAKY